MDTIQLNLGAKVPLSIDPASAHSATGNRVAIDVSSLRVTIDDPSICFFKPLFDGTPAGHLCSLAVGSTVVRLHGENGELDNAEVNVTDETLAKVSIVRGVPLMKAEGDVPDAITFTGATPVETQQDVAATISKPDLLAALGAASAWHRPLFIVSITDGDGHVVATVDDNATWTLTPGAEWIGTASLAVEVTDGTATATGVLSFTASVADDPGDGGSPE